MKDTKRTGPTVYGVLDRLEDLGWATSHWEAQRPDEHRPRRRLYQLTGQGRAGIYDLLEEKRPQELKRLSEQRLGPPGPRRSIVPDGTG
jgi:PadR family transcriptional regulator PadR